MKSHGLASQGADSVDFLGNRMQYRAARLMYVGALATIICLAFGCREKVPRKEVEFSKSNCVSIVFGEPETEYGGGLQHVYWEQDGLSTISEVGGELCRLVNLESGSDIGYLYFVIHPSFKKHNVRSVKIEVEYFDAKPGLFGVEYDAATPKKPDSAYCRLAQTEYLSGLEKWQVASFRIQNASFKNSENSGADFRLWITSPEIYIRRVAMIRNAKR